MFKVKFIFTHALQMLDTLLTTLIREMQNENVEGSESGGQTGGPQVYTLRRQDLCRA